MIIHCLIFFTFAPPHTFACCECNSRSNTWHDPKKFWALMGNRTPTSHYPGKYHIARLPRHWLLSHSSLQGESMLSCVSSSDITLATKCNSESNKWHDSKHFCASTGNQTLASRYPGEHHTARLPRHWSLSHSPLQILSLNRESNPGLSLSGWASYR